MLTRFSLIVPITLLVGCGGTQVVPFSPEARARVRNVTVSQAISAEGTFSGSLPGIDFSSGGAAFYGTFITAPIGMVWDLFVWNEDKQRRSDLFESRLEGLEVDVPALARQEFVRHVEGAHLFDSVRNDRGEAEFRLEIEYGLSDGWGFDNLWKPWLRVEGSLVDATGAVLWRDATEVKTGDERVPSLDHHPLRKPEHLRKAYRRAARVAARELIESLFETG